MNILFVSSLSSRRLVSQIFETYHTNPGFAIQKFNRLLARGLVRNGCVVDTLSCMPIPPSAPKRFYSEKSEEDEGVRYHYIRIYNTTGVRQLFLFFASFFKTLKWCIKTRGDKAVIYDALNISICIGSLWAAKLCGTKTVGILTDMPGILSSRTAKEGSLKGSLTVWVNKSYLKSFSSYVFMTQEANDVVNTKGRPFMIIDGFVDEDEATPETPVKKKLKERSILYAGGLHERLGIDLMIESFMRLEGDDLRLIIYGDGSHFMSKLKPYLEKDSRIVYKGIAPNKEVVAAEHEASLLIDPAPTSDPFTLYSFPFKNLEYMLSGTPLVTTRFVGIPKEDYPYMFLFDEESVDGFAAKLKEIMAMPSEELEVLGKKAKDYAYKEKNSVVQSKKILDFVEL